MIFDLILTDMGRGWKDIPAPSPSVCYETFFFLYCGQFTFKSISMLILYRRNEIYYIYWYFFQDRCKVGTVLDFFFQKAPILSNRAPKL